MKSTKTDTFQFLPSPLEICRNHDHDKRPDDGNDDDIVGVTTKNFWKPDRIDDPSEDEDACWEDCTSKEGADADYCEGEHRVLVLGLWSSIDVENG